MHIPCDNLIYAYVICDLQFELNFALKTSQLKMHVKLGRVPLINALHEECNFYNVTLWLQIFNWVSSCETNFPMVYI